MAEDMKVPFLGSLPLDPRIGMYSTWLEKSIKRYIYIQFVATLGAQIRLMINLVNYLGESNVVYCFGSIRSFVEIDKGINLNLSVDVII